MDEDIRAAVITIPAAFALRQCEATKKAAQLAGFLQCPLLQEPVAASLAYGFQSDSSKKQFWLVFDFGGGTFDAAVMKAEDGDIQVVNHGGDNFLGGADIDWGVIDNIIIPNIVKSYNLPDFKRGSARWRGPLAKIKRAVENAKIDLSRSTEAYLDGCIFEDDDGNEVELDGFKLTQNQLSDIAEPLINRAVEKCKSVLTEKGLPISAIAKTILVGGPTLAPYFRDILADKLGVPIDHSVDPLTVVSQGAAIFAGTQRLDRSIRGSDSAKLAIGTYKLSVNYKPIGPDDDPKINGEVTPPEGFSVDGCTIEFVNRKTKWSSGAIRLNDEGKFALRLRAERGDQNIFDITLSDANGTKLPCDTTEIPYTIGATIRAQITCSDISIELVGNERKLIVPKGTEYPFKKTLRDCKSSIELKRGQPGRLVIPVLEAIGGDAGRLADHNRKLGELVLTSDNMQRDLHMGSDIEVTISAKEPGTLKVEAYIPILNDMFSAKIDMNHKDRASESDLRSEFGKEKARVQEILNKANAAGTQIEDEINDKIKDIDSNWVGVGDVEGANQVQTRIIELRRQLDDLEEQAKVPEKIAEIEEYLAAVDRYSSNLSSAQRSEFDSLKSQLERCRSKKNINAIERLKENTLELWRDVMYSRPEHWRGLLSYEYQNRNEMSDQTEANRLFSQAAKAIDANDVDMMRKCALRLIHLLPPVLQDSAQRGHIGDGDGGLLG